MVRRKKEVEESQKLHDQHVDPDTPTRDDAIIVYARSGDRSRWWKFAENIQKYSAAYAVGAAVFFALGFGIITPQRTSAAINARIDTGNVIAVRERAEMQMQIDSLRLGKEQLEMHLNDMRAETAVLIRMACADRFSSRHDKQIAGLLDNAGNCIR